MHLLHLLAAAAPSGDPTLKPGLDPNQVTPGPWGFFITFGLAIAVILLIWDMARRIRRVRYREQMEQEAQASAAAGTQAENRPGDRVENDGGGEPPESGDGGHPETEQERQRRLDRELNGKVTGRPAPGQGEDPRHPSSGGPAGS